MWPTIILVLCLMVATAIIAYWSDNLGKKLGKKRVTLFGLRPKQTATLITIGSSMPIMLFTLGATLLAYKPLRDSLTKYEATRRDRDAALQQKESAEKSAAQAAVQLKGLQGDVESAQEDKKKALDERRKARSESRKAFKALGEARKNVASESQKAQAAVRAAEAAQRDAERARRDVEGARRRAEAARKAARDAKNDERQARQRERNATAAASQAQARLSAANRALGTANTKLASVNAELDRTQAQLAKAKQDVARVTADKERVIVERDRATRERDRASKILDENSKKILGQEKQILAQQERYNRASQELEALRKTLQDARNQPTLIRVGESLAEAEIEPGQSAQQVQARLAILIKNAEAQVRSIGEEAGISNLKMEIAAARVTDESGSVEELSRSQLLDIVTQKLVQSGTASSMRIVAARTHTVTEPTVNVRLIDVEIGNALRRDDLLAEGEVDGTKGEGEIFRSITDIAERAVGVAGQRGVVPPISNSRNLRLYTPESYDRFFAAVRSVKALGGTARVRIVAASELSTAAPLNIRFIITPASSVAPSGGPTT